MMNDRNKMIGKLQKSQSGNIFMALFAAVAFMGVLGVATTSYIKGPLTSSVNVSRVSMAEYQMRVASNVAIRQAAALPNSGDCDGDGMVEPIEYEDAGSGDAPVGGGYYPDALGASVTDPWGVRYGYCVWNGGAAVTGANAACDDNADSTEQRLDGQPNVTKPVVALISAGKNRQFETTCSAYIDDATDMISKDAGSDDVILSYTYEEASSYGGGLWSINPTDSETAEIDKTIEFAGGMSMGTVASTTADDCDGPEDANRLYFDDVERQVVRCDGAGNWQSVLGGGEGEVGYLRQDDGTSVCGPSSEGEIRYNTSLNKVERCNGASWDGNDSFAPSTLLAAPPYANYDMDITGPCNAGECPLGYSNYETFTIRNLGGVDSDYISKDYSAYLGGANPENFEIDWASSTCDNNVYLPAYTGSCQIDVRAKADRNMSYSANLTVTDGTNSVIVYLSGESAGLSCSSGDYIEGGYVVGDCTGADGGPGDTQVIVQEEGCGTGTSNPTCSGDSSDDGVFPARTLLMSPTLTNAGDGEANSRNILSYSNLPATQLPAADYCETLDLNGYTDWYLPAIDEANAAYSRNEIREKLFQGVYITSRKIDVDVHAGTALFYQTKDFSSGTIGVSAIPDNYLVRCARKRGASPATSTADTNPEYYLNTEAVYDSFPVINIYTDANTQGSYSFYISGYNRTITLAVSGDGAPTLNTDQGNGPSISLAPAGRVGVTILGTAGASGTTTDAFLISGADIIPIRIHALDPTDETLIFVTENLYDGDNGGLAGVDSICQAEAQTAGISNFTDYKALVSTTTDDARNRLSQYTSAIYNMNNDLLADDINELSSAEIQNTINYYADGSAYVADDDNNEFSMVRTASLTTLRKESSSLSRTCQDFTSASGSTTLGNVNHFDHRWIRHSASQPCAALRNYYCFGPKNSGGSWKEVIPAGAFTCGLKTDDTAWCWGYGGSSKLGNGGVTSDSETPVAVAGGHTWDRVSTLNSSTCALRKSDGNILCWGINYDGQLGDGTYDERDVPTPIDSNDTWTYLSKGSADGGYHMCAVLFDGSAWCWGDNSDYQLGDNSVSNSNIPIEVPGGYTWKTIEVGPSHTCGIRNDDMAMCWGNQSAGKLGNGVNTSAPEHMPQLISGHTWKDLSLGLEHTCGIDTSNKAWCWGNDSYGELGNGSGVTGDQSTPTSVSGGDDWESISTRGGYYTCGIKLADKSAWCWGINSGLIQGTGSNTSSTDVPTAVSSSDAWTHISAGSAHTCGVTDDGKGWCWGSDGDGELGNGATTGTQGTPNEVVEP